jgi:membrane-associated phospholipid phosphatase
MVLAVLVAVSVLAGLVVAGAAARLHPRPRPAPQVDVDADVAPEAATGIGLTLAIVVLIAGGLVLAVLTFLVRGNSTGIGLDKAAADWGHEHGGGVTSDVLDTITYVGRPMSIIVLAVVLAVVETVRTRSRWIIPFVALVVAGNGVLTTTIKHLADRVRPTLNPIAETLGPSFPSGHSSWSAAFFAAAALVLSRGRSRSVRIALAGAAAALAVAIASTRVLLAVHWLSDVVAGLALGWAWFAACSIAFGGRLLRFGATAESAGVGRGGVDVFAGNARR